MMTRELHDKYLIMNADGSETPEGAEYFVLRIDTDKAARLALGIYAEEQWRLGEKTFAEALWQWVNKFMDEVERKEVIQCIGLDA